MYVYKNILSLVVILIIIIGGAYYFLNSGEEANYNRNTPPAVINEVIDDIETEDTTVPTEEPITEIGPVEQIGKSVSGNAITAYHFGNGEKELLFIGEFMAVILGTQPYLALN